eukprot:CAMPEP_0117050356 /NCGR_PEP_ID=MMETSP0472-20121206/34764_1 /TAXON_ID=693140 ORGANISM="Tiarina fusus, Strain LIS" /NCGR_SAMPLE_ID=MMETSP0472 /ASSEMBLY_ACC=CAM_ASM_000603 /LENGTH=136 /DNA_ID=CAMNT_0004764099 /DNA_START=46 /DNA_END=456 /DNA_ORIENTATION=+
MTKSDNSYASIPISEPYVEGFAVGSSHAVTVIVDENDNCRGTSPQNSNILLDGSRKPVQLSMCPKCSQAHVRTRTKTYPSALTWVSVVVGAAVFFPLCWIPLVVDPMKQTDHYCQSCGTKIGTIKPLDGCFVKEQM